MLSANEIRNSFLDFFKSKDHRITPSAPVVPHNDPTLLFTNAGMNQFKDVFLGIGKRDYVRAANSQKCVRVSGKHNDLEEVGFDTYHHTFFEMLGNWSFGDYYKEEAIAWAWELLTDVWGLEKDRLFATVYKTDDESYEIWKKFLPESRILKFGEKDNFWEMGEIGPCGPCSEIHYDRTPDKSGASLVNAGSQDVIEIWNLVFIQYDRQENGELKNLPARHVDTGMGFERIVSVIQNKTSNYDTDLFIPLIRKIEELSGKKYPADPSDPNGVAMRVMADHIRTLSFAIADGVVPGNEGRSYVLRRILRRASRFARNLGLLEPSLFKLVPALVETMGDYFKELKENLPLIEKIVKKEEEGFITALEKGLKKFEKFKNEAEARGDKKITGAEAFLLYDTFGFPIDLTRLIAKENGLEVDEAEYRKKMDERKLASREARGKIAMKTELPALDLKSEFVGYDEFETEATVLYAKDRYIVLDKTPFYAESGGQVADTGTIIYGGISYEIIDVQKSGDAIVHIADSNVEEVVGAKAKAKIDADRRRDITKNHTATHLLHEALRQTLGKQAKQAGSLVAPEYLRFDFSHYDKISKEELLKIEKIVNDAIFANLPVKTEIAPLEEAKKNPNIKMFFGDKYGDIVRIVSVGENFSMELCGGAHVKTTSEISMFKIISESSIAAGTRRIEAITGRAVYEYLLKLERKLETAEIEKAELNKNILKLEREAQKIKIDAAKSEVEKWLNKAVVKNGVKIVAQKISAENINELRNLGEKLRESLAAQGLGLLAADIGGKAQLVCVATDDIKQKAPAGKIVGAAAKSIGGGGGGKPHLATAGAKDASKIDELIAHFPDIAEKFLAD